MTCRASSKKSSVKSTTDVGFESGGRMNAICPDSPNSTLHDSAKTISAGILQVIIEANDNMADLVLTICPAPAEHSNQSGEGDIHIFMPSRKQVAFVGRFRGLFWRLLHE